MTHPAASPPSPAPLAPGHASEPVTMFAAHCPFRRNGTPVLGTMGSTIRTVVVFEMSEWQRLCEQVPALATTQFRVGTFDD